MSPECCWLLAEAVGDPNADRPPKELDEKVAAPPNTLDDPKGDGPLIDEPPPKTLPPPKGDAADGAGACEAPKMFDDGDCATGFTSGEQMLKPCKPESLLETVD